MWPLRVLTRKNSPPPGGHVFQPTSIIFELVQDIIGIHLLTKFHEDWTINVASKVKNAPPLGSHVFQAKVSIFDLIQDIIGTNLLSMKNAPPPGGHVFQPTGIIFDLVQDIIGKNLLTKFHEDQTINVASTNVTIFELIQDIIETNLLTKLHEDWTINVASRELTRQMLTSHNGQKAIIIVTMSTLCLGELKIGTCSNIWNKSYWTIYVTSRVLTRKTAPTDLLTKFHEELDY
ncbi:hypothetical protein DPMN_012901 [Dreissena polymorpha]|uniref:Uncharacterized protein n=1 Tax=Dreissena polymorpha TaxID=45954 RepID=A0A9D4N7X0_DREPO|nr:hypothetical protein DPMN_012901 [Dreissena polymorpha]